MVFHRGGPKSRHGRSSGILAERATGGPKSMMDGKIGASLAVIPHNGEKVYKQMRMCSTLR